ncbi:hypothetical protein JST97_27060 [bacterium]|nr:hypothetical protein [bacterium]
MIQIHSGLKATMTQFLRSGSLGEGAKADKPFLGEFGTLMLATQSVQPLFQADQVDGVDIAPAPNQVEINPSALKNDPNFSGYSDCSRVRCEFEGPKEDPDQVTIHSQTKDGEQLVMVNYNGKPDGSAVIRYVSADARDNEVGWYLQGHELTLKPGDSPFDAQCKTEVLIINPRPSLAS